MLAVLVFAGSALAEPVAVNRGAGQGFIFLHRGNCYVILPQHVHERRQRVSLVTAQPSTVGEADIFRSFAPGTDLSIGLVRRGMERRCTDQWSDLPARTDALLDGTDVATLVRLSSGGQEQRVPVRIIGRDLETLRATPLDASSSAEIFQGTSGAMLRVDGGVVGMAIQSRNVGEATFLRIDEIKARLERLLEARTDAPPQEDGNSTQTSAEGCAAGLPIRSVACSREPVAAEFGCANLAAGEGIAVLPAGFTEIIVELDVKQATPLGEIALSSAPVEGQAAAPKAIRVEVDSSSSGPPRWRSYGAGDMTPFGAFRIENGAKPFARRIRLALETSWAPELPTTLTCLTVR